MTQSAIKSDHTTSRINTQTKLMKSQPHPQIKSAIIRTTCVSGALVLAGLFCSGPAVQAAVPADPAVEFRFPEGPADAGGNGITTTNSGALAGLATFAQPVDPLWETNLYPAFSTNVPSGVYVPAANDYSVYFGPIIGNSLGGSHGRAIDLSPEVSPGFGSIGAFPKLTVCGWVNASSLAVGGGGNRIAFALETPGGLGFDLVQRANGQLSLIINQYNDGSPESSPNVITADANMGTNNWIFFAATYDPELPSGQVKYYFGRNNKLASLDVARDYILATPPGTNVDYTGVLTLGNFGAVEGARDAALGGNSRIYRGLLDEIKVYTNAFTLDEVQQAQLNSIVTPVAASIIKLPINTVAIEGQNPNFSVEATGSGLVTYQWKTNGVNVSGATNASLTFASVTLSQNNTLVTVGVSNTVGGVLTSPVTLTVLPGEPLVVQTSFSEGSGNTTTNLGSLAGYGLFRRTSGLPAFITTNVPSGPFAPSPAHNPVSINHGLAGANRAIDLTNTLVSSSGALGSLNALTICGWINSGNSTFRTTSTGRGNGIVNATLGGNAGGFVLSYRSDDLSAVYNQNGRLQFHANEWASDIANNLSSMGTVPLDTNHTASGWIFFAVTYDGTKTETNLNFYFGNPQTAATNDVVQTYNKGVIVNSAQLTLGNHNTSAGNPTGRTVSGNNGTAFRGLMDEIKIYSKVLTLAEIRQAQIAPALPTLLVYSNAGPNLDLSWEALAATPYVLQSSTNLGTGPWSTVPGGSSVSGNIHSVTVPKSKDAEFFRITR